MWKLHFNTHWKHKTPQLQSQVVCYFFFHFCCNQQRFICNVFANLEELKGMNRNKRKFDENISLTWSIWQDEMTKTKKKKKYTAKESLQLKSKWMKFQFHVYFCSFLAHIAAPQVKTIILLFSLEFCQ